MPLVCPEWAGQMPSSPLLLLRSWKVPPTCLSCSPPPSLLRPQDQHSPERASEGIGPGLRAGQASWANWAGETLGALPLDPSPQGSLRAWEPLPHPSHPSAAQSCPASTSALPSVPPHPTRSLGGSSRLLGRQGLPPASGRRPSCGETLTPRLPMPPS